MPTKSTSPKLLQGYGAVTPKNKPEDFQELRESFEHGVADEMISEQEREHTDPFGTWKLDPTQSDYEFGLPPQSGLYRIESEGSGLSRRRA